MFPTLLDFNSKHMTAHDTSRSIGRLAQPAMASAKGSFLTGRSWLWLPLPCQDRQRAGDPRGQVSSPSLSDEDDEPEQDGNLLKVTEQAFLGKDQECLVVLLCRGQ